MLLRFLPAPLLLSPDELGPSGGAAPSKGITCDFCKCRLDAEGGVLRASDVAKKYAKLQDDVDELRAKADEHKNHRQELEAKIRELEKGTPAKPAGNEWP